MRPPLGLRPPGGLIRAPAVADYYSGAWQDFTLPLTPDRDVKIQIVGCRPGEKLFEELFDAAEKRVKPPVPGVLGAVPTPVPLSVLYEAFERLRSSAAEGDTVSVFETMNLILSRQFVQKGDHLN